MYCRNCGKEVHEKAVACPACGVPPLLEKKYCSNCGSPTQVNQAMCTKCGVAVTNSGGSSGTKSKIVAGLLAIFLNCLGIHKFYLGYNKEGAIYLAISLIAGLPTCFVSVGIMTVIGWIEGIIYLTKSDEDFDRIYVQGRKGWF